MKKSPYEIGEITGYLRAKIDWPLTDYIQYMANALKYDIEATRQFARGFKVGYDKEKARLQSLK